MKKKASIFSKLRPLIFLLSVCSLRDVQALELDWSGQFWSEFNFVFNYTMDSADSSGILDPTRAAAGGYYVPGGGNKDTTFQSLFLRLRPKLVVNDNIYIKSEWWVGDPIFGLFGNGLPYSTDQRQYYSSQNRGSYITAQRFWGEFITDIGTFQVGRVPLQWGLGLIWNSGDNVWDRYMSTGDAIRWIAKFGSFSFIPSLIINSSGITIGGNAAVNNTTGGFTSGGGSGSVQDYSLIFKYENTEDELEGGINILRRLGGSGQDPTYNVSMPNGLSGSMNFIAYDIYARKKLDRFTLGAELPIVSGSLGSASYQSFGFAGEVNWKPTDSAELMLKAGYASGQPNTGNSSLDSYRAFYFNPNYHIGMVMFNYQLANFYRPQTMNNPNLDPRNLGSPYDNPIVNAGYAALSANVKPWEKWTIRPGLVYARAPQTAATTGYFFNTNSRNLVQNLSGKSQGNELGWEFDLGITFQWDEYFQFSLDNGVFFPGSYYAFSNTATDNATSAVFATSVRIGINF